MTFRFKTVVGVTLIQVLFLTLLIYSGLGWLHQSNERQLVNHASATTRTFASIVKIPLLSRDLASLDIYIGDMLRNQHLIYARVRGENGKLVAEMGNKEALARPFIVDDDPSAVNDEVFDTFENIYSSGIYLGRVEVGYSVGEFNLLLESARIDAITIATIGLFFAALFSLFLGVFLTSRLQVLRKASEEIGREGAGYTIPVRGGDEIASVMTAFNDMSGRLAKSHDAQELALQKSNEIASRLQISEAQKASMLEEALDGIITIDMDGVIIQYNASAEAIFGHTRDEAIGCALGTLIVPHRYREAHQQGMKRMAKNGEAKVVGQRLELPGLHKNGNEFPMEIAITRIETEHGTFFTAFMRDISERKRQQQDLEDARARAEQANAAKSRFLGVMSHELRTPLNAIINTNQLLISTDLGEEQRDYVKAANEAGENLYAMIDMILEYSRSDRDEVEKKMVPVEPRALTSAVFNMLLKKGESKGLAMNIDVDPDVPQSILTDQRLLRQILIHFVSNAVKFTRSGEINLRVRKEKPASGDVLLFEVEDTGIGIEKELQSTLFDEFTVADNSYKRETSGMGLGLAISSKLARTLNGVIGVESEFGKGSCFWLRLPLVEAEVPVSLPESDETRLDADLEANNSILIVDDSKANILVAGAILKKAGYVIGDAENGQLAVEAVIQGDYGLVIMDLSMPVMDGFEATARIRQLPGERGKVPVIALTAGAIEDEEQRCRETGMNGYLKKPVQRDELLATVKQWLEPDA